VGAAWLPWSMMDRDKGSARLAEERMRVRAVGADALLLEVDDPAAWYAELRRRRDLGELEVLDIVPGARTVLLDGLTDQASAAEAVRGWRADGVSAAPGPDVTIPVTFDGADLADVAALWEVTPPEVARRLEQTPFQVAFCGFAPGFAYLSGLPEQLALPRLATPRPKVPAGSVGLADRYAGVYPAASPAGWRIVGRTDVTLFDAARTPPALLSPGTRVRFIAIDSTVDLPGAGPRESPVESAP
jgi:KipI family sensor histidine kinase inhibitor